MQSLRRIFGYLRPYRRQAILSLLALTTLVFLDLAIPRLIQRIIDEGILKNDQPLVLQTAALMLVISALSAVIAVGNNIFSVQAGEGVARDLRDALLCGKPWSSNTGAPSSGPPTATSKVRSPRLM